MYVYVYNPGNAIVFHGATFRLDPKQYTSVTEEIAKWLKDTGAPLLFETDSNFPPPFIRYTASSVD